MVWSNSLPGSGGPATWPDIADCDCTAMFPDGSSERSLRVGSTLGSFEFSDRPNGGVDHRPIEDAMRFIVSPQ